MEPCGFKSLYVLTLGVLSEMGMYIMYLSGICQGL